MAAALLVLEALANGGAILKSPAANIISISIDGTIQDLISGQKNKSTCRKTTQDFVGLSSGSETGALYVG